MFNEKSSFGTRLTHHIVNSRVTVRIMRMLFSFMRRFAPGLSLGGLSFITRHADVIEALERDQDFTISQINAPSTERNNGPFVLSMDRSVVHDREKALLNEVMPREDIARITDIVHREAQTLVREAESNGCGEIELVGGLTRIVPLRLLDVYFGTPGPSQERMAHWMRAIFYDVFVNYTGDAAVTEIAGRAYEELKSYLLDLIAHTRERLEKDPETVADTMLSRLIKKQADYDWLDDDTIRRNISGVIVGAVDTTSKAAIHAIDELLRRPQALAGAREAALTGDMDKLREYAYEALRFNPHGPVVARYCEKGATLGEAGKRAIRIKPASKVFIATLSAMYDAKVVASPNRFKTNRDIDYLHFGHGLHQCQGIYINAVQIPALLAAVFKLKDLRRARGAPGRIRYDGPFPDSLTVEFSS